MPQEPQGERLARVEARLEIALSRLDKISSTQDVIRDEVRESAASRKATQPWLDRIIAAVIALAVSGITNHLPLSR
jgi:hypothetical protein